MNPHRFAAGLFALTLFLAMLAVLLLGSPRVRAVSTGFSGVVIDANATPLANIDVLLWRRTDSANGAIWAFTNVSTKTAPSGLFSLVIPTAGEYVLEFADPSGEYLKEFYDDKLSAAEAAPFLIEVGDSVVVTGTLARSGKISGVVTSAVAPYQPLDDINVSAWREGVGGWQDATVATTDSDGKYTIAGLRTGTYRLQFTSIATAAFFTLYYPNQPILEEAESIPVEAGELITGFDAALEPKSEVRGRILPPAGKSAEDYSACLTATNPQIDPWTLAPLECALLNPTGPNGDYHFSPLHAGEYQIYFGDSRLPPRVAAGWYAAAGSLAPSLSGATSIEVSTGVVVTAATVTLEPTYSIVGEVRMPNATNAEDAEVRVYREDGEIWRWWHTTHTRAEGKLVYAIPHAGVYTVGIFADGMAPRYHAVSTTFADSTITQVPTDTVTVPAVQVVENVVAGGFVNGLVVDQGGAPLPGMEVHLFLWDAHTEESDNVRAPEWLRSTTTDEAGAYLLDGLGDESVWLLARDPAGALADIWYPGPPSRPNAPPLTITGTETVLPDLVMAMPASAITVSTVALSPEAYGIVRDRDTDESIPNATISLYWLPGWRARLNPRDFQAQTCPSAESEGVQIPTGDAANAFAGKDAFAGIGMFAPDASSILSDGAGRFGWRLTPGCWYLHASAQGYRDIWSPVWGVASDEDNTPQWVLALEPLPVTPTPETPTPETPTPETPTPETPTPETPTPETPTLETITPVTPTVEATISPSPSISPVSTPNPGIPPSITPLPTTHTPVPPLTPVVAETATPPPPMPTRVPTQPAETATPPMTVFVYGTLFNDSNWNQTQEVGEEGIAGMVLELTRTGNLTETVTAEGIAGSWRREATTSEQGAYLFTVVPPGRYTLSITPPEGIVLRSSSRLWLTIDESSDRLLLPIGVSAAGAFVLLPLILR